MKRQSLERQSLDRRTCLQRPRQYRRQKSLVRKGRLYDRHAAHIIFTIGLAVYEAAGHGASVAGPIDTSAATPLVCLEDTSEVRHEKKSAAAEKNASGAVTITIEDGPSEDRPNSLSSLIFSEGKWQIHLLRNKLFDVALFSHRQTTLLEPGEYVRC